MESDSYITKKQKKQKQSIHKDIKVPRMLSVLSTYQQLIISSYTDLGQPGGGATR